MLRNRLVVVLTLNDGVLFRTRNFVPDYRYTLNFVDTWLVDELIVLDITRPGGGDRQNFYHAVEDLASKCFVPLAVGGGEHRTNASCESVAPALSWPKKSSIAVSWSERRSGSGG